MLSYRHHFHAGNHADVFKHLALTQLLTAMKRKEKPMFYLETHAGAGVYDLESPMARKIKEHEMGISKIYELDDVPEFVQPYFKILSQMNPNGALRWYPGSPWIAKSLLDENDRLMLNELHKSDYAILHDMARFYPNIKTFHQEGLMQLNAMLPPKERRGLIFIDPSYEVKQDYIATAQAVAQGYAKFATGVYAIWYPLLKSGVHYPLLDALKDANYEKTFNIEFKATVPKEVGMYGSGLFIINPPWQIEETLRETIRWLREYL